jgi:6-phosphogluconolactonase (cycloisomerase 2 family)
MLENRCVRSKFRCGFLGIFVCLLLLPLTARAGFLYLLNDDSTGNRIYGFRVNESTGELTALAGFPVSAAVGGINNIVSERMTVDPVNGRLYVVNEGSDTISAYSIDRTTGSIAPMPFSPISLGAGVWNTIAVHPSGSPLIVANNSLNGVVQSFVITPTTATAAAGSPFGVGSTAGFSSRFSVDGTFYYVGGNQGNNIAGFSVNATTGVLTTLPGSPFASGGTAPLAYGIDSAGRLFSVDNTFFIRVFTSTDGVLAPVTGNPFTSGLTQRRFGLIHYNQNFYIVAGNTGNNVGVYQIAGSGAATTVTPVTGSPFATGATTANTLALNQSGTLLFVGNRVTRNVTKFTMDPATGILSGQTVQPSNTLGTVGAINGIGYLPDALAVNAQIGGRITDAAGIGIGKVFVQLTSMDGMTRLSAVTSPFGYYNFSQVITGTTYTITPFRKGYTFSPTSIVRNHTGDATDLNFIGQPD